MLRNGGIWRNGIFHASNVGLILTALTNNSYGIYATGTATEWNGGN